MGLLLSGAQDHHGQKVSSINRDRLCPLLSDDQIRRPDAATAIALDYPQGRSFVWRDQHVFSAGGTEWDRGLGTATPGQQGIPA